jgi:hypothetical protein
LVRPKGAPPDQESDARRDDGEGDEKKDAALLGLHASAE